MEEVRTIPPGDYIYTNGIPEGCFGHRYRVHRMVLDVPSRQQKVLVQAIDGDDAGLWFTCTVGNFEIRYRPANEGDPPPPAEDPPDRDWSIQRASAPI